MSVQTKIPFRETKRCLRNRKSINYAEFGKCSKDSENSEIVKKNSHGLRKLQLVRSRERSTLKEENHIVNSLLELSPTKIKCIDIENINISSSTKVLPNVQNILQNQLEKKLSIKSRYQKAKEVLNNSMFLSMPCRENEIKKISDLLQYHLKKKESGSVYISGPPGTGKTASLMNILKNSSFINKYHQVYVNCACIKSSKSIYVEIVDSLKITLDDHDNNYLKCIESYLSRTEKMILLILDEIDQLETRNQSVLYTIFEWPAIKSNSIVLIGIANALDLTDRILPRLQANINLKPTLIHFAPYKKQDIIEIITKRLTDANVENVFSSVALQMLASKIAAVSGDLRRALDICRRAIELVEQTYDDRVLQPTLNEANVENNEIRQVGLKEIMLVLNNIFSSSKKLDDDKNEALPLQQKIILCTLILMLKKGRTRDILVGKLHETYKKICNKRNISAVDQVEFVGLLGLIESRGILSVSGRKDVKFQKVFLQWDEEEVMYVLKDKLLMSSILEDTLCLGLKK